MMKRMSFILLLGVVLGAGAFAQTNEFVDGLLGKAKMSYGQASYLVLVASDNLGEDADESRAFEQLQNLGWADKTAKADASISMADYSKILMKAFGMKGGVVYSLTHNSRYAYRELLSLQVIQGHADPSASVDGTTAVRMLGRIFDVMGLNK